VFFVYRNPVGKIFPKYHDVARYHTVESKTLFSLPFIVKKIAFLKSTQITNDTCAGVVDQYFNIKAILI